VTRDRHPMPNDVAKALLAAGVRPHYDARPNYQRNDYIGWIDQARTAKTRSKRIAQMLDELERGGVYMKMPHPASAALLSEVDSSLMADKRRPLRQVRISANRRHRTPRR
jgi:bacteriocin resistance YdeI/OmpD-like protein